MQKAKQEYQGGCRALPIVMYEGNPLFVDLRLDEFRLVQRPFESIPFGSVFGRDLCGMSGIHTCKSCNTSIMLSRNTEEQQVRCPNCFNRL